MGFLKERMEERVGKEEERTRIDNGKRIIELYLGKT